MQNSWGRSILGLLNLWNIPTEDTDTSPVQKIFGQQTRSMISMTSDKLNTGDSMEAKVREKKSFDIKSQLNEQKPS